ncbi:hypothetical protein LINPERHAP1_LOCUS37360 [Linum perenne]
MNRKFKIHKSSSAADLTPANRNSFADYALSKSTSPPTHPPPVDSFDIDDEPNFVLPLPPPITVAPKLKLLELGSCGADWKRLDLTDARREYEKCRTESQKAELKVVMKRAVLSQLKELSEMEAKSKVGIEIAEAVDFLKILCSSDSALKEVITEISEKSREGVMRLQEGQLLVMKSQDQLRSALRHKIFCIE